MESNRLTLRKILLLVAMVIVLVALYEIGYAIYISQTTGILQLHTTDRNIIVTISQVGRKSANVHSDQRIRLKPGTYQVIASKDQAQTEGNVHIITKQLLNYEVPTPKPVTQTTVSPTVAHASKLVQLLPFTGPRFSYKITYTYHFSNNQAVPTIVVTAPTQQAQQDAIAWIKAQGYDPTQLTIQYVTAQP